MMKLPKADMESIDTESILQALDTERRNFTRSDKQKILEMVSELVRRGVYPQKPSDRYPENTHSTETMVDSYGAKWHEWSGPTSCVACGSDLRDLRFGPPFKREVGIVENDHCVQFRCPDCGKSPT